MSKTYTLATLADIYDQVPKDRIEACMAELARGMVYAKEFGELGGGPLEWKAPCEWVDDGLKNMTITLQDADSKDTFALELHQEA